MRYRLRTLLILLAVLPPVLAVGWWKYSAWRAEQERQRMAAEISRQIEATWLTLPPPEPVPASPPQPKAPAKAGE